MAWHADRATSLEIRWRLNMRPEHNQAEVSRVNGENSSVLAVASCDSPSER
jgi:hypothetical protein